MFIKPDCIPCILKMTISSLRKLPLDEKAVKALYTEILQLPALRGLVWDITSPAIIEEVWQKITDAVESRDPFHELKSSQNEQILALYPFLEKMVNEAADPLKMAVKLSIMGNSMDFMVADSSLTIEKSIAEKTKLPLTDKDYSQFRQQLENTRYLLIFGDNAGEIVFDRLLIQIIKMQYQPEITFVVRSLPTLNDATLTEAKAVGINKFATVLENGIDGPLPGTVLGRCSSEVNTLVEQSDLIISKGGGNFDTLDEERKHLNKKISFLLLSKCAPHHDNFGVQLYHPVLFNKF
ncbi:MAG: ARMT1-like domain-containing protein [Desulfobacterales bacterium]|nr:ARMT1-like domain-containing protein [Desulfobacterales bacterium]